jgi:hypothetical protein
MSERETVVELPFATGEGVVDLRGPGGLEVEDTWQRRVTRQEDQQHGLALPAGGGLGYGCGLLSRLFVSTVS